MELNTNYEKAYLAGGCFWGIEELFRDQRGIIDSEVGYCGGSNDNPTYDYHPGHAETVALTFDTSATTYEQILDYFFRIHDPTTLNQQGNDRGSSYRSTIFYTSNDQLSVAKAIIDKVNRSKLYKSKVVTTLEPLLKFYPAEEYHQQYLLKNPGGYTCHFVRSNKSII